MSEKIYLKVYSEKQSDCESHLPLFSFICQFKLHEYDEVGSDRRKSLQAQNIIEIPRPNYLQQIFIRNVEEVVDSSATTPS